jgi:hypothetical protein
MQRSNSFGQFFLGGFEDLQLAHSPPVATASAMMRSSGQDGRWIDIISLPASGSDDGAATADLGCFDKTCLQQRHRSIGEIEIKQNARMIRRTRLLEICESPCSPGEIGAPDSHDDSCNYVKGNDHAFLLSLARSSSAASFARASV